MSLQIIDDDEGKGSQLVPMYPGSEPPVAAQIAFQEYKDLGSMRSITALHRIYVSRVAKDKHASVPTTSVYQLAQWETMYNWKALAWEHDAEANNEYMQHRKEILSEVYDAQIIKANKILELSGQALEGMDIKKFSPQDALKYSTEGMKMRKEAAEQKLALEDPTNQQQGGATDFFDTVRKLGLLQVNNSNIQINVGKQNG